MNKFNFKAICSLAALLMVGACGDSGGGNSSSGARQAEEVAPEDGSNIDGHYQAKFITMNGHVNGTIPGSANFHRKEEKMFVYVRLFAGGVKAWHMQHVYTGGRCPTLNDDTNLDGFIDIQEAEAVMGKILIPLDSDISSQSSGRRFFPLADLSGYYHYERITNFKRFLNDLKSEDKDPEDDTVKLAPGEGLRISGKTVLIQGVAETVELPETVATKGRHRAFQTLPIACGVFGKVEAIPGEPYVLDQIPGPVGEVVEGQDRPADEEIPPPTTGGSTSGSTTGRTNDSDEGDGPVSDGEGGTSGSSTSGSTTGSSTGGSTTGRTTSGTTGGTSGSTTGSSTSGSTTGSSTGETTGQSTAGSTTGSGSSTTTSSSSSSTTTTTTGGSSSSSTSTSTGTSTGGFLDSSSGV